MGSVYEVEHAELRKTFVLKVLHGHLSSRPDLVARMRNEWRALGRLNHPNIVQVTDAGQGYGGLPYFVMEHLQGKTLGQLLAEQGKLPFVTIGTILCDVLEALSAAHLTGAIHRDVKPQNIFLQNDGMTKLLDFGIAKLRDQAAVVVTAGGVSIGTPRYMAPEQAEGTKVDGRADIYAVGLVMYEALVGRGPFAHIQDPNELVMAHIGEEPERADDMDPNVPPEVGDLIQRWLSKSPNSRPTTAELAGHELRALLRALPAPTNSADSASVTLGWRFDASTVGALPEGAEGKPQVADARNVTRFGGAGAPGGRIDALAPTETFAPGRGSVPQRTLGWGTDLAEAAAPGSPLRPRRSRTPPPLSSSRGSPRAAGRGSLLVLATAVLSFLGAWSLVYWWAGRKAQEPAPEHRNAFDLPGGLATGSGSATTSATSASAAPGRSESGSSGPREATAADTEVMPADPATSGLQGQTTQAGSGLSQEQAGFLGGTPPRTAPSESEVLALQPELPAVPVAPPAQAEISAARRDAVQQPESGSSPRPTGRPAPGKASPPPNSTPPTHKTKTELPSLPDSGLW